MQEKLEKKILGQQKKIPEIKSEMSMLALSKKIWIILKYFGPDPNLFLTHSRGQNIYVFQISNQT